MQKQGYYSIRTKLIVIYLLIAIPLITLLGLTFYNQYRNEQESALTERFDIARLTSSNFELFIDQTIHTELVAGNTIVEQNLSPEGMNKLMTRITKSPHPLKQHPSPISNATFIDKNGVVLAAAIPKTVGQNRSAFPAIKAVIDGKDVAVGNLRINADGQPGFLVATAIRAGNELAGIVSVAIKAEALSGVLDVATQEGGSHIVDASGHLIFQSQTTNIPFSERDWSKEPFVRTALSGKVYRSTGITFPIDNSFRTGVEVPIPDIGWTAGSFLPVDQVLGPIRQDAVVSIALALVVLAVTLLLAYILGNRIVESLITLKKRMRAAPETGFKEHVSLQTRDEIEDLADSFNLMEDEIIAAQSRQRKLQEELRDRNEELSELYERQKNIASILQESLLPKIAERVDRLETGLQFQSATEAALVGGDFFDFIGISKTRFGLVIGDVSGKGIEAATLATTIRNTIRAFAYDETSPAEVISKVNEISILETLPSIFVTLFYGVFDSETHELTYANAAHWPPLIYDPAKQTFLTLETGGLPIAMFKNAEYVDHAMELTSGLTLVLYTDGVVESRRAGEFFGTTGLKKSTEKHAPLPPGEIAQDIIEDAKAFAGGKLLDDAAVMVVKVI